MTNVHSLPRYLSFEEVRQRGHVFSRTHMWRLVKQGAFPAPKQLNPLVGKRGSRKAWLLEDIEAHERRLAGVSAGKAA